MMRKKGYRCLPASLLLLVGCQNCNALRESPLALRKAAIINHASDLLYQKTTRFIETGYTKGGLTEDEQYILLRNIVARIQSEERIPLPEFDLYSHLIESTTDKVRVRIFKPIAQRPTPPAQPFYVLYD